MGRDAKGTPLKGLLLGLAFGFLLQKGGVAKFEILIGALLLRDFTVIEVMLSAIAVGMVGVLLLERFFGIPAGSKPTRYAANACGGLVFGAGFALSAYCPGTGAAALGQGNFDALFVLLGLMAGSFVYALLSAPLGRGLERIGDRGGLSLPDLFGISKAATAAGAVILILLVLALLARV